MNQQEKILKNIAEQQGIPIKKAEEMLSLFIRKITDSIKENKYDEEGFLLIPENFEVFHIKGIGKLKPKVERINRINNDRQKKGRDNIRLYNRRDSISQTNGEPERDSG